MIQYCVFNMQKKADG